MMRRVLIIAPIIALFMLAACREKFKKEENPPTVNFISPVQGGVYETGDTVPVKATFVDDSKVMAFSADVNKFVYASSIFNCAKSPNAPGATLDTFMVIPSAMYGNYQYVLYCQDPYGNYTTKSVNFTAVLP